MIIKNNKISKNRSLKGCAATILCLSLIGSSITGCSKFKNNSETEYKKASDKDITKTYVIKAIDSDSSDFSDNLFKGYTDALDDLIGHKNYTIKTSNVTDKSSCDEAVIDILKDNPDLIVANGYMAISESSVATSTVPIIGTGVMNFQAMFHSNNTDISAALGTNVTGTSTLMPMEDVTSLIIESQPSISAVGLLYSPEDRDAIYQNEHIESYLDQAGIPWREYELNSTDAEKASTYNNYEAVTVDQTPSDSSASAITPKDRNASSSFEGQDIDPESIGESVLFSTASNPSSARAPKHSALLDQNISAGQVPADQAAADPSIPSVQNGSSTYDIVKYAATECNVLYIPGRSTLADQVSDITSAAMELNVPTVSSDPNAARNTLTALYADPYAMGYEAGKQAYRILIKGDDPSDMSIEDAPDSTMVKLYNAGLAEKLGRTFPKSFHEVESYLNETDPGATTKRIVDTPE
jgi:ABC-type uncharacterized transport system substrate-binding protein